ncbi:elongator complex protein 2 [Osmerus mordax]|uniref:elongator complex protein 2 n=1 Tax=Osmerus mordax TaxID=8014 RepID=UPI00350EBC93
MAAPVMQTCHVACCANRTPNVLSWGRGGLIAYGTCHSVAVYDPKEKIVVAVLNGHTGRVNTVEWVHRQDCDAETHLVSGGSDNCVILWEAQDGKFAKAVECTGHTGPVCSVDAVQLNQTQILIASTASDSSVRLWLSNRTEAECIHTISFGSGFMMDVSLALLPGSRVPILACGGDDCKVYLYVQSNGQFQMALSLPGHDDWIRGLEWSSPLEGELLLASCSQDSLIRVWKLCVKSGSERDVQGDPTIIKMKQDVFTVTRRDVSSAYAVSLETVLAGHENWVYGVHWQPPVTKGGALRQPLSLLSASMDKTMILWAPEEEGVWVEQVRVGEVGGNTLGFYGCQMSPDGSMIVAHAFHGALHLWYQDQNQHQKGEWRPGVVISGHFSGVQDLSWDPEGEFLLSVGLDQTTRLLTPWRRGGRTKTTWHEISRPQIHGYDMQCLAMVGRFQFVSGADEKVLRVFRAPRNFVENFANISGNPLEKLLASSDTAELPEGASTPALGLSNKAVFQDDLTSKTYQEGEPGFSSVSDQYQESYFHPLTLNEPPPEDHLLQNTLWPEVQKLYGHGFEMFCVASDSLKTVVASACKASKAEHAAVLLWSASSWRQLQALPCHTLTITQMAFSPDAHFLLAVSRDRTWSLWQRDQPPPGEDAEPHFSLYTHTGKDTAVHTRIIWSCDWSADSKYFVTSSRDKKVMVWGECSPEASASPPAIRPCSSILDVGDAATAVSFCPIPCSDHSYLLAVGLECGRILLYRWTPPEDPAENRGADWNRHGETNAFQSHTLAVKRLRWRPRGGLAGVVGGTATGEESPWVQLASAGNDHTVKIFNVNRLVL